MTAFSGRAAPLTDAGVAAAAQAIGTTSQTTITQARLREALHYDLETGEFRWIGTKAHRIKNGDIAGTVHRKKSASDLCYRIINIDYHLYKAHRLAWLYVHGYMPNRIDHRDGDGLNNRISNLRVCTQSQNMANKRSSGRNSSGYRGVSWCKKYQMWRVSISFNGKQKHIGYFYDIQEAASTYERKAAEMFESFHRPIVRDA